MKKTFMPALLGSTLLAVAPTLALASECKNVPEGGSVSLEAKYIKIKHDDEDSAKKFTAYRTHDSNHINLYGKVHFRPRNGSCYVAYSPYSGSAPLVSNHPGCDADKWAWARNVAFAQTGSSENDNRAAKPEGKTFDGSVRFDMMKTKYEVKYTYKVLEREKKGNFSDSYSVRITKVCLRSF